MPTYPHEDVVVRFADGLAGTSVSNLLSNEGTFLVDMLSKKRGELFSLLSPEYRIQMFIDDGYVAFRRNEYEVRKEIGQFRQHFTIIAKWGPDFSSASWQMTIGTKSPPPLRQHLFTFRLAW